ncbi:MAG: DUF1599 domain-containing protein [Bacteroidota bacterium]
MNQTQQQYEAVIARCKSLFLKKAQDYGTSWRILRMPSITDQIYIKAERIRSIQESGENKVGDSIEGEFMGIINYCAIALILWKFQGKDEQEIEAKVSNLADLETLYDEQVTMSYEVMEKKNHDYGEAWRKMRISSITDLILMKIFRLKKIEDNKGELLVSEGVDANYVDMLNYAVFSLIKMNV